MPNRRTVLTTAIGLAAGAAVAGCEGANASGNKAKWTGGGPSGSASPAAPGFAMTVTPAGDAKDVSPGAPVVVSVEGGTLQTVTVTGATKTVDGALDADQRTWRSTGALAYGVTYTVAVSAVDSKGTTQQSNTTFATLKPTSTAGATFQANPLQALKTGGTYGVGQTVCVHFSKAVKDHATAEQAMQVVTSPAVEGRWRWIDNQNAHWRPEKYWASGTKITVNVNILGVNLGNGVYGAANASTNYTIGQSRIAIADATSHYMQCFIDGQMVRNIPVSLGKGGGTTGSKGEKISFTTMSGPHVILEKVPVVRMSSASYGITNKDDPNFYDETVRLACRISFSGEYVHLADWNIPAHGVRNTSHGCVNVGPANAQWFFDNFQVGDVVDVIHTNRPFGLGDGLGDWTIPWDKW
jgi:lipoprotein-anchoring transpeptidase ErfK/SrfK